MAEKVILKDLNSVEILPITRGELVLDSSGNPALHSNEFLATENRPGLMSAEDKKRLDDLENTGPGADNKVAQVNTTTSDVYRLLFSETATDETKTEGARKSAKLTFNPSTGVLQTTALIGNLDGTYVNKLTGYTKATTVAGITSEDSLSTALGKLELKADTTYDLVRGAYDGDGTIENLAEILKVLDGIKDTETIQAIVGKYLPLSGGTIDGNFGSLKIKRNAAWASAIKFENSGGDLGYIGFNDDYSACIWNSSSTVMHTLLHSGNYNAYAPKLDGTGATGTWNIDISGTAANTSKLNNITDSGFIKQLSGTYEDLTSLLSNASSNRGDHFVSIRSKNWGSICNIKSMDWGCGLMYFQNTLTSTSGVLGKGLLLPQSGNKIYVLTYSGNTTTNTITADAIATETQLGNYVTLDTNQTITGLKTFTNENESLCINRTGTYSVEPCIGYYKNGTRLGALGLKESVGPFYWDTVTVYNILHSGNYNSYAPKLDGTGATGTWGINISGSASKLGGFSELDFFRYRGALYQNNNHDANALSIGEYAFRGSAYGNVGSGSAHKNSLGENSTIQVFKWLQLSTIAWSDTVSYRVNWTGETNSARPSGWSPWINFLSGSNYTNYINETNFPGINKTGTITGVTAGSGLSGGGTSGSVTLTNTGVRSVTLNGNYLKVNTNGTDFNLTIPYATNTNGLTGGSKPNWGVLKSSDYTHVWQYIDNGSAVALGTKAGGPDRQFSMQIDGFFYQNEGNYMVLDTNNISSYAITQHQSLANYVTLDSAQTITGVKTFASNTFILAGREHSDIKHATQYAYNWGGYGGTNTTPNYTGMYNSLDFQWYGDTWSIGNLRSSGSTTNGFGIGLKKIDNNGDLYFAPAFRITETESYINNNKVWHAGNDGSGSGLDADLLDGFQLNTGSEGKCFGKIPVIGTDGVTELGHYIDWHYDNTTTKDYSTRLQVSGNYNNVVNLPSASGTLALTSQIPSVTSYYWANIPISDSPLTNTTPTFGRVKISGDQPIVFTKYGSGTYNIGTIECTSTAIYLERPRKEDKSSADILPLIISQRGGGIAAKFYGDNLYVAGNIGVGTDSPTYKLDIRNTANVDYDFHIYNSTTKASLYVGNEAFWYGTSKTGTANIFSINSGCTYDGGGGTNVFKVLASGVVTASSYVNATRFHLSNTAADYCGLMPNSVITKGGAAADIWLYNDNKVSIYGSSIALTNNTTVSGSVSASSGFVHPSYGSSAYALTSDGGVAHIGSMSVNYANSAGSTSIITRTWQRGNDALIDLASYHNQTRVFMADSDTANKPGAGAGFIIANSWDWGGGGALLYQDFDSDYGRLYTNSKQCDATSYTGWKKVAWTSDIPTVTNYYWANLSVQASASDTTVPSFGAIRMNGVASAGTNYITGPAGRIFFGGNFHLDSLGSNATYINHYTANNVYLCSGSSQGKVGIRTASPSYPLHVAGDTYTSGWSRAASGFYIHDKGVHYSNNGTHGEISMTSNNGFNWGASTNTLYFNYNAVSRGTTVTSYVWNAGSSSSYATHKLGSVHIYSNGSSYNESIRIHPSSGGWHAIVLCGTDNTGDSGVSTNTWGIYGNSGKIYINKGSSDGKGNPRAMGTSTGWTFGNTDLNSYALNAASFICASWVRTKGVTGWYNEDYGGGWYMEDSTWIRNYNSKPLYYSINSHNGYGTGGHRLAACFYGSSHVSILLLNSSNGWGLNSNSDGNFYFGFRNKCSASDTSADSYPSYLTKSGSWYATHYYESSDKRLKENIQKVLDSDNIPQIKKFNWKNTGELSYGLIAQELEEQGYSELVSVKDDGYKTVNYSAALSLIVGKLQNKIKELEAEIENLKLRA